MSGYSTPPALHTRKPTGNPSWPLLLVEGGEKTGKSFAAAQLTASDHIGSAYWLDWGEGSADEYAAIPGADYQVIDHDGTWNDITGQVAAVAAEGQRAVEAGEPPVLLVIDSMTAEWDDLKAWADQVARSTPSVRRKLAKDPGAEISVPMNVWSDVHTRHYTLMRQLMRFPGIVVITARGKETVALDDNGRPKEHARDYKVEGHKNLAYDASAWIRLSRDAAPTVVGARSVHHGIRPGVDKPRQVPDLTLDWLVFDVLLNGATPQPRNLVHAAPTVTPAAEPEPEPDTPSTRQAAPAAPVDWDAAIQEVTPDVVALQDLWRAAKAAGADVDVLSRIERAGKRAATDWDAELRNAGDDVDALQELWREAHTAGVDGSTLARIEAAGKAANGGEGVQA